MVEETGIRERRRTEVKAALMSAARIELTRVGAAGLSVRAIAREMDRDQIVVVQETEYTGAGKHHNSQLAFARSMGIEVRRGDPRENVPGKNIVIPERLAQVAGHDQPLDKLRISYLKNAAKILPAENWSPEDKAFLAADVKKDPAWLESVLPQLKA